MYLYTALVAEFDWKLVELSIMAEFDHNDSSPICDFVKDIQNLTDHKIADELIISNPDVRLLIKTFMPMVFVIGCIANV